MNSSRHANRSGRGQSLSRGRGRRGHSRGGFNQRNDLDSGSPSVPTISQVVPGAPVSIVLKVDQPTGRQVQGMVAELLTRGNHPRGIKVRLQDGRVGRVQRMASEEEAKTGSAGLSGLGRNGEGGGVGVGRGVQSVSQLGGFTANKYSDFRVDSPDEPPRPELSLEDYVVVKGNKKSRRKDASELDPNMQGTEASQADAPDDTSELPSAMSLCPVCGEFEGDETAVAHHVNTHFD